MSIRKYTATPSDGVTIGWDLDLSSQARDEPKRTFHRLVWTAEGDGTFTAVTANLANREYRLTAEIKGSGRTLEIAVDVKDSIITPPGKTWPMKLDTGQQTMTSETYYFIPGV